MHRIASMLGRCRPHFVQLGRYGPLLPGLRRVDSPGNRGSSPSFGMIGPNDIFEISGNSSPDPPDDDEEVIEPHDYTGDYPLETDDGDC